MIAKVVMSFTQYLQRLSGQWPNAAMVELVKLGDRRILSISSKAKVKENSLLRAKWSSATHLSYHNTYPRIISNTRINHLVRLCFREYGLGR